MKKRSGVCIGLGWEWEEGCRTVGKDKLAPQTVGELLGSRDLRNKVKINGVNRTSKKKTSTTSN